MTEMFTLVKIYGYIRAKISLVAMGDLGT